MDIKSAPLISQTPFSKFNQMLGDALNGITENNTFAKITDDILKDSGLQKSKTVLNKVLKLLKISETDEQLENTDRNTIAAGAIACLSAQKVVHTQIAEKPYVQKEKTFDHLRILIFKDYLSADNKALILNSLAKKSNIGGRNSSYKPRIFGSGDYDFFTVHEFFKTVFTSENKEAQSEHIARLQQNGFDILQDSLERAITYPYRDNFHGCGYVSVLIDLPLKFSQNNFLQEKTIQLFHGYIDRNKFELNTKANQFRSLAEDIAEDFPIEKIWLEQKADLNTEEFTLQEKFNKFSYGIRNHGTSRHYQEGIAEMEQTLNEFKKAHEILEINRQAFAYFPAPKLFAEK